MALAEAGIASGRVMRGSTPVSGAAVHARLADAPAVGGSNSVTTNDQGEFKFENLAVGRHELTFVIGKKGAADSIRTSRALDIIPGKVNRCDLNVEVVWRPIDCRLFGKNHVAVDGGAVLTENGSTALMQRAEHDNKWCAVVTPEPCVVRIESLQFRTSEFEGATRSALYASLPSIDGLDNVLELNIEGPTIEVHLGDAGGSFPTARLVGLPQLNGKQWNSAFALPHFDSPGKRTFIGIPDGSLVRLESDGRFEMVRSEMTVSASSNSTKSMSWPPR